MNKEISMGRFLGDLGIDGVVRVDANELRELIKSKYALDREVNELKNVCMELDKWVSSLKNEIEELKKNKESELLVTDLNGKNTQEQNTDKTSDVFEINRNNTKNECMFKNWYTVFEINRNNTKNECIFKKWYVVNENNIHYIFYSESSDGIEWSEGTPIVIIGVNFDDVSYVNIESVVKVDGIYSMVFSVTRNNKIEKHRVLSVYGLIWEKQS